VRRVVRRAVYGVRMARGFGADTIPNIPSGAYQVVVTIPGFQHSTARDIVVTNRRRRR